MPVTTKKFTKSVQSTKSIRTHLAVESCNTLFCESIVTVEATEWLLSKILVTIGAVESCSALLVLVTVGAAEWLQGEIEDLSFKRH